jgi:hypothetical protein
METAQETFDTLLRDYVAPPLRERGFRRKGSTFGLRGNAVWGVINFQKDRWSNRDEVSFTVNVSVRSDFLGEQDIRGLSVPVSGRTIPAEMDCDIRRRIGFLIPGHRDTWWKLSAGVLNQEVISQVHQAIIEHAVPWLRDRRSDEAILEHHQTDAPSLDIAVLMSRYRPDQFQNYASTVIAEALAAKGPYYNFALGVLRKYGYTD